MLNDFWNSPKRILAIRLDNIGDIVMLGPALRSLRNSFPQARITLMASPAGSQVGPLLPWIDDVFTWRAVWQDISGGAELAPERETELVNTLREREFDAAIIFTSFSQSPYPPAYACYLAGVPVRIGQSNEFGGGLLSRWVKPPSDEGHQVDRNLFLLEQAGLRIAGRHLELEVPYETQASADRLLAARGVNPHTPFIVIAPGASCAARRYDPERFARVIRALSDRRELPVVIVGSSKERERLAPILSPAGRMNSPRADRIVSLVGKTSVPQLAAIIRRSSLVIANNSASLHIADAFQVPMVILYSGTELESQWMPRSSPARLLRRYTRCSPCYRFTCPFQMECLDIPPGEVLRAADELLPDKEQLQVAFDSTLSN